ELAAQRLATLERGLVAAMRDRCERAGQRLGAVAGALELVSPQAVLERGYAIVGDTQGRVLRDASQAVVGQALRIRLAAGALEAEVTATRAEPTRADP
nr:exodeoxyribonuclease VII large subunit [Burkholderiaceae bacterium]